MLHRLIQSPFHCDISLLLRFIQTHDDLLFMQDGVIAALKENPFLDVLLNSSARLYALHHDLAARGLLDKISPEITIIHYDDFVVLTEKHRQFMIW